MGYTYRELIWKRDVISERFYDYPLLHICLFLFFAFCIGGLLAGVALALSGLLKNIFMVWVSVFVLNYLYESLVGIVCKMVRQPIIRSPMHIKSPPWERWNYRLW